MWKTTDIADKLLNLIAGQSALVRRHGVVQSPAGTDAGLDDLRQFRVALILNSRGTQVVDLRGFSYRRVASPVGAVARGTFGLENACGVILRPGCRHKENYGRKN